MNKYTLKLSADILIIIHFARKDACSLRFAARESVKAMNVRGCRNESICVLMYFVSINTCRDMNKNMKVVNFGLVFRGRQ